MAEQLLTAAQQGFETADALSALYNATIVYSNSGPHLGGAYDHPASTWTGGAGDPVRSAVVAQAGTNSILFPTNKPVWSVTLSPTGGDMTGVEPYSGGAGTLTQFYIASIGCVFVISGYFLQPSAGNPPTVSMTAFIRFCSGLTGAADVVYTDSYSGGSLLRDTWVPFEATFTAPAGTAYAHISLFTGLNTSSSYNTVYWDSLSVTRACPAPPSLPGPLNTRVRLEELPYVISPAGLTVPDETLGP